MRIQEAKEEIDREMGKRTFRTVERRPVYYGEGVFSFLWWITWFAQGSIWIIGGADLGWCVARIKETKGEKQPSQDA